MARVRTVYFCTSCGNESVRWEGRCPACGEWNSMAEAPRPGARGAGRAPRGSDGARSEVRPLAATREGDSTRRVQVGLGELDRLLGGGIVPGSVVLLGGRPGIGKSTLLLQASAALRSSGRRALYVSGEESPGQVGRRAARLGAGAKGVRFLAATEVEEILRVADEERPEVLFVDSVQTTVSTRSEGAPGSPSQLRDAAGALHRFAKETGCSVWLVGHVTKEGALAGPKLLEHLVDVVLHFEGQRTAEHRLLRASKNRFGSAEEIALFRMRADGLEPVADPSSFFLADRPAHVSGSVVAVPLQGSRPVLAEIQSLTSESRYASPRRVPSGFPARRLAMLLAVLERRGGVPLGGADVFVNVVGGLRLSDPGADLAVVASLASARLDRPVPGDLAFVGEVGLGGEIRGVAFGERRVEEVARSGLEGVVVPRALAGVTAGGVAVRACSTVGEVVELLRG